MNGNERKAEKGRNKKVEEERQTAAKEMNGEADGMGMEGIA